MAGRAGRRPMRRRELLVDTQWLADHLEDRDIRIVDSDVATAYQRCHIPGAVLVPDNYQKDPDTHAIHILPPDKVRPDDGVYRHWR